MHIDDREFRWEEKHRAMKEVIDSFQQNIIAYNMWLSSSGQCSSVQVCKLNYKLAEVWSLGSA